MAWGEITDEGLAEAAALIGQPLRRTRMQWIEIATRDAIRHFAWGIGDDNPLWLDRDYAGASPLGGITAPPCILYALDSTIVAPKLAGVQWIYAGTGFTWYEPIREGDTFTVEAKLTKQQEKSGRRFARWVLQTGEIIYRNQHGRVAATATGHCARTPRLSHNDGAKKAGSIKTSTPVPEAEAQRYTAEELELIEREIMAEQRRGAEPLYWEDVAVGDSVPSVLKGPLSVTDILGWYSATQGALHYGGTHGDAIRYRRRHADYHINPKTGAKDSAGRGHLEASTGKDVGMGGVYDVGPQRIAWAQHMLCNWIGDHGFLHKLDVSVRRPNLEGDTIRWHGTVTGKRDVGAVRFVDLDVEALCQRGHHSAGGTAVVVLPSRADGPVPLPLPMPLPVEG
ncbi:MAG: FAS1-like dehydratase domain-containing protein [Alphaproteobacteria bacterium]